MDTRMVCANQGPGKDVVDSTLDGQRNMENLNKREERVV